MNLYLLFAAALCLYGAMFHEKVGTPKIAAPIMASDLDVRIKAIAKIVWHSITFILSVFGLALIYMAVSKPNLLAIFIISAIALSFAILFWFCSRKYLGKANFFPHPWVFSVIGALSIIGGFV